MPVDIGGASLRHIRYHTLGTDCRMSLKSKLEAVIYAAEEPVTMAQLASLFAAEALEYKATQEAEEQAKAAQASAATVDPTQHMIAEGLEYLELRTEDGTLLEQPGFAVAPTTEPGQVSPSEAAGSPAPETGADTSESATTAETASVDADQTTPSDPETDGKRVARQRDRDVKAVLRQLLDELIASYSSDDRGIEIREIAGGFRIATKPECHDAVRLFIRSMKPALKLSLPALETLAVIAYKQPVTAPEVNEIRGVDSSGVFGSLLARKLITTAGRKQVIGRPILYKTTKEFLLRFGLKDISELPSMDEFEKLAAIELEEEPATSAEAESDSGYEPPPGSGPELDEYAPEDPHEIKQPESAAVEEPAERAATPE
jgi:segregation and condensation protein B